MGVEISDADWDVLDKTIRGGVNEDDIAYTINAYREEGRSDEEIQGILNNVISRNRPAYDNIMRQVKQTDPELEQMKAKQARREKYLYSWADPLMGAMEAVGHTAGRAANTMTLGVFDAGAGIIDNLAGYVGIQSNLVGYINDANKRLPVATMVGDVGGLFGGVPKAVAEASTKAMTKLVGTGRSWLGGAVKGAATGAVTNVAVQAGMEIQKTAEKVAGTREEETEEEFYNRVTGETGWSVGLGAATGVIMGGPIGGAIKKIVDPQVKAVNVCGGAKVVKNAQAAFQEALVGGASPEQAEHAFWREVMARNDPRNQEHIKHMIKTDPAFSRYMRQQMASAGAIVTDTMTGLSEAQIGEYANQIKKSLYGPNYTNKIGSTDFDNTKEGMAQILGTDDGGAVYKVREEALGRAKRIVEADAGTRATVAGEFNNLANNLRTKGEGIYRTMLNKVEAGTMKSYAGSKEAEEANAAFQDWIMARQQNGIVTSQERAEQERRALNRAGAQKYFDRKMTLGTDNIDDINDIKTFFAEQAPADVTKGQSTALGAFDEGINANIYDKLDQGLYETNQAYRYTKKMQNMHDFGYNFDPDTQVIALKRSLGNTTDAEFEAAKLAAFKMGWTAKLQDAAVSGNTIEFERLSSKMIEGPFSKYFSKQEVKEIVDQVRPHIETKFLIEQNLKAAQGVTELSKEDIQIIREITSAGIGARGAFLNSVTSHLANYKYGPKTAKAIMTLAKNPSLENFNNLVKGTKDAAEKRALITAIKNAFNQTNLQLAEEAMITKEARDAND